MGGLALEGGCPLCFLTQGHVKKSMVWWPCFFCRNQECLGEQFNGGPFSKAQKHHCFCGQGTGEIRRVFGYGGAVPLKGGVLCDLGKHVF